MKHTFVFLLLLLSRLSYAQSDSNLLEAAQDLPPMPTNNISLAQLLGRDITIAAGTPYNDLEYTIFDTDYVDGETSGYDTFFPVDPSDESPGSDRINFVLCTTNPPTDSIYDENGGDRIILGLPERPEPFFLRGADGVDNDFAVIRHFDFRSALIQLSGEASNYRMPYYTTADGVDTEGYYLFYVGAGEPDLVAFIFPCSDVDTSRGGLRTEVCNADGTISLNDPDRFAFVNRVAQRPVLPNGIAQVGSTGKDLVHGVTTDARGNIYLYGSGDGNLDDNVDPGHEIFVMKLNAAGEQQWVTEVEQPNGALLWDGQADNEHLYVAGRTLGALPGFENAGGWDGIILKLSLRTGEIIATDQWGNAGLDGYGNITLDDAGNLFVSGAGSPVGTLTGDSAYVIAKHRTADLANVWRAIDPVDETASRLSEGWGGLTYVAGDTPGNGRLVTGGWFISPEQPPQGAQGFVVVYGGLNQNAPRQVANQQIGAPGFRADWVIDNVVDADGYIYAAGFTTGALENSTQQGLGDAFIVRFDPDLSNPKFVQFGTPFADQIRKIQVAADGSIYATGYTYGDFAGENADPTHRTGDVFVQQFDQELNLLNATQFGTRGEERSFLHIADSTLYVAGTTERALTGDYQGAFDGFVLTLNPEDLSALPSDTLRRPVAGSGDSLLLRKAATYQAQPENVPQVLATSPSQTFGSGSPFNDLIYTMLNTTSMEGETHGYDTFFPADPGDPYPGDRLMLIKAVNNLQFLETFDGQQGDRFILGTAEAPPFFLAGEDSIDNEWAVIQHFDYRNGHIQLKGSPEDYGLVYGTLEDGVATEGNYLFYTADGNADLVAFIYPCNYVVPTISGSTPGDSTILCNDSQRLSLTDPNQFKYAEPVSADLAVPEAVQIGTPSNDLIHGSVADDQGNVYLYGSGYGTLGGRSNPSENALIVVKISESGEQMWALEVPTADGGLLFDAVTDEEYLYAAGRTFGALEDNAPAGLWDGVLLKVDLQSGELVDSDLWGNQQLDGYGNITLDDAGHLYVSGAGSPPEANSTDADHLLAKHDAATLDNIWRVFSPPAAEDPLVSEAWGGISYLPGNTPGDGQVVISGWYFGGPGGSNTFLSVYNELNQRVPNRQYTTTLSSDETQADWSLDNVADSQGNIYVAGYTTGNLEGAHQGNGDFYVAKYSNALELLKIVQWGTPQSDALRKLVIDDEDMLYVSGYTYGNYEGSNADANQLTADVVVQKLDTDLNLLEAQQLGSPGEERGFVNYDNGLLYVAGVTEGSLSDVNQGGFDGFVSYLDPETLEVLNAGEKVADEDNPPRKRKRRPGRVRQAMVSYPNPSRDRITVNLTKAIKQYSYVILDKLGKVCMQGTNGEDAPSIDISRLPPDTYYLKLSLPDGDTTTRIVKE